jgi:hypothetical protein
MARRVFIALAVLFIVAGAYSIGTPGTPDGNRGWNIAGFEWNSGNPRPVN